METQWEYKEETVSAMVVTEKKNELGQKGWEVYDQKEIPNESEGASYKLFLKRQKQGPQLLKS